MLFSQRIGKKSVKVDIQIDSMDMELRNSLWNTLLVFIFKPIDDAYIQYTSYETLFKYIWIELFKKPLDEMPIWGPDITRRIRKWFFECEWYEVYDFIEFIVIIDSPLNKEEYIRISNYVLEKELSGYRFISDKISPIMNDNEILGIENALEDTETNKLKGTHLHLKTALGMLVDRKNPDYRNSIKESISAVESISKIILGDSKTDLGKALNLIGDEISIHPALKKGFTNIYGYTSDEDGIRHSIFEEKDIYFEDAKYMLVSCSAFVSYLIVKADKAGIKLS